MPKIGAKQRLKTPQNKGLKRPEKDPKKGPKPQGVLGGTQGFSGKVVQNTGKVLCFNVKNFTKEHTKIYTKNLLKIY